MAKSLIALSALFGFALAAPLVLCTSNNGLTRVRTGGQATFQAAASAFTGLDQAASVKSVAYLTSNSNTSYIFSVDMASGVALAPIFQLRDTGSFNYVTGIVADPFFKRIVWAELSGRLATCDPVNCNSTYREIWAAGSHSPVFELVRFNDSAVAVTPQKSPVVQFVDVYTGNSVSSVSETCATPSVRDPSGNNWTLCSSSRAGSGNQGIYRNGAKWLGLPVSDLLRSQTMTYEPVEGRLYWACGSNSETICVSSPVTGTAGIDYVISLSGAGQIQKCVARVPPTISLFPARNSVTTLKSSQFNATLYVLFNGETLWNGPTVAESSECFAFYSYVAKSGDSWAKAYTQKMSIISERYGARSYEFKASLRAPDNGTVLEATAYCNIFGEQVWVEGSTGNAVFVHEATAIAIVEGTNKSTPSGTVIPIVGPQVNITIVTSYGPADGTDRKFAIDYTSGNLDQYGAYFTCTLRWGWVNNFGDAWSTINLMQMTVQPQGIPFAPFVHDGNQDIFLGKINVPIPKTQKLEATAYCEANGKGVWKASNMLFL